MADTKLSDNCQDVTSLWAEIHRLRKSENKIQEEVISLHRKLAAETLRADLMASRYESANRDRNSLREEKAALASTNTTNENEEKIELEKWAFYQKMTNSNFDPIWDSYRKGKAVGLVKT